MVVTDNKHVQHSFFTESEQDGIVFCSLFCFVIALCCHVQMHFDMDPLVLPLGYGRSITLDLAPVPRLNSLHIY